MTASTRPCLVGAALLCAAAAAMAQAQSAGAGIYSCTDAQGRRLTADRPIAACSHKEQQILNRDGSLRGVLPPTLTVEERAQIEARERSEAEARAAVADAVRRDRNLKARYPNEASHLRAREAALDSVRLAQKTTEQRLRELQRERVPLNNEAEFYQGRTLPPKLRAAIEANEAAAEAQKTAAATQASEIGRINRIYDIELARLKQLWAGVQPGSMGPLQAQPARSTAATARPPAAVTPASPASR